MTRLSITRKYLSENRIDWILVSTYLCQLSTEDQDRLLECMEWRSFGRDEVIIPEGHEGPGVELLVEGQAVVQSRGPDGLFQARERIGPGHLIGERSLLLGKKTAGEVRAIGPVRSLHIEPDDFRRLLALSPTLRAVAEKLLELHERSGGILDLLLRNPFFRLLGRGDLELILQSGSIESVPAGHRIVRAGDRGSDVYVLLRGRVAIYAPGLPGSQKELLDIALPGVLFGHAAPLLELRRTADIDAVEPSEYLMVPARAFMEIVSQNPSMLRRLYRELAAMDLRAEDAQAASRRTLLVAISGSPSGVGSTTVAYAMAAELAIDEKVILVDLSGATTAQRLGLAESDGEVHDIAIRRMEAPASWGFGVVWPRNPDGTLPLLRALRDDQGRYSHVLVHPEGREPLDLAAIGECEAAVFVHNADDTGRIEAPRHNQFRIEALRLAPVATDLALGALANAVRIPHDPVSAAAFWRSRDVARLREESGSFGRACRRLVRVLRGRSVGLALGGGGALGFAHVGLLRVLRRAGIPIDYISGASFGAVVAGVFAAGGDDAIEELVKRRHQLKWVFHGSMIWTGIITHFIEQIIGARFLASTEIPFLPASMDLLTGREVVLVRGTVGQGVRASSCLPGPFSAWRLGSWRLVDGGIINNVPASITWEAGANFIIASNVIPATPAALVSKERKGLLGKLPSLVFTRMDDLLQSMYWLMSQAGRDRAYLSDYVFDPRLDGHGIQDWVLGDVIADAGERQAEIELPSIRVAYKNDSAVRITRQRDRNT